MEHPRAGEDRWTLEEWEESGICSGSPESPNRIVGLRLTGNLGGLRIADPAKNAVEFDRSNGTRAMKPIKGRPLGTLSRASLGDLFPDDVASLRWESPVPKQFRSACKSS